MQKGNIGSMTAKMLQKLLLNYINFFISNKRRFKLKTLPQKQTFLTKKNYLAKTRLNAFNCTVGKRIRFLHEKRNDTCKKHVFLMKNAFILIKEALFIRKTRTLFNRAFIRVQMGFR